ncbi:RlpA-like double-psi beta-barrel-protein domain-containing protein-containing protein [Dunaliella salina]|uniref:RlpA-like double-psi beta-barrel-protein domain-containing protein-containing protein n=1 Tax=Dunaliella salina TaxID=3046 RepID=A0ABQ7H4E2_DUNSA|nr:RlpA-like double-psi beta-barrel-protein domain-containing protein-containing protein [Dunaliella salina]|eukprot:KAF5841716.1 RlpA-like double-psi beta-barrel-protein domain-containing protein-containing protein [Dunaliella salina]
MRSFSACAALALLGSLATCRSRVFPTEEHETAPASPQSRNLQSLWDGWQEGRATHYGDEQDNPSGYKGTTIHEGSCLYWYLDKNVGTGWDIAALSDHNYDFDGSCGNCYEVKCSNMGFRDGNGEYIDRTSACYDESKSVVVRVTDACPCNYEANAKSNYRWCCGDMYTMDLSYMAFRQLADRELGVIGIKYRRTECPPDTPPNTPEQDGRNRAFDRSTY